MKQRGGKREGSGRKAKEPTSTINFRVPTDRVNYLKPLVAEYIKTLLNPNGNQATQPAPIKTTLKAAPKKPTSTSEPTMAELLRDMVKKNK